MREALVDELRAHHRALAEDLGPEVPDDVRVAQLRQQRGLAQEARRHAVVAAGVRQLEVHDAQQHGLLGAQPLAAEQPALGAALHDLLLDQQLVEEAKVAAQDGPELPAVRGLAPEPADRRRALEQVALAQPAEDLQQDVAAVAVGARARGGGGASEGLLPGLHGLGRRGDIVVALLPALRRRERRGVHADALQRPPLRYRRLAARVGILVLQVIHGAWRGERGR
mmetsp:Transcript_49546/g.127899  ORF Transcript_49546/g.127899 Transcript_49546/m.127899 type:complete len:225 (+) Transcript_49546:811-1485(+)